MEDLEEWENDSPSSYDHFYRQINIPELSDDILITQISAILTGQTADNRNINVDRTPFDSLRIPSINQPDYFNRILKYSIISRECYIISLIYIDRYTTSHPNCCLTSYNIHKLIMVSVLCAAKFMDDFCYNNADMAKIGGMNIQELNKLEEVFQTTIDFDLYVTIEEYQGIVQYITGQIDENVNEQNV